MTLLEQTWTFLIIATIAYLGSIAGLIVSLMAQEELKPGKKYLTSLWWASVIVTYATFAYYEPGSIILLAALAAAIIALRYQYAHYYVAPIMIFYTQHPGVIAPLVFLQGMSLAGLTSDDKHPVREVLAKSAPYMVTAISICLLVAVYAMSYSI